MIADQTNQPRANPHTGATRPVRGGLVADACVNLTRRLARQALLERYLLGRLDEGARAVLRASAIANPHVFAEVRETEIDLLDALAGGTLDRDRASLVHASLPFGNRDSWSVSQALAERVPHVRPFALVEPVGARWRSRARAQHLFSSHLQVWPAAAMIVIAAGLWFARNPHAPFVGPPGVPAAVTATASASMPVLTLHLSAEASGATTTTPRRLRLVQGTSRLRIEVTLPPDMPSLVDVAIQRADGRVLWSVRRMAPVRSDGARSDGAALVAVSIPADSLVTGRLSLVVSPSDGSRPARRTAFFLE